MIVMSDDFELGNITVFNNFRVYEVAFAWRLEGGEGGDFSSQLNYDLQ